MASDDSNSNLPKARIILQQCLSAKLQVQPRTEEQEAQFVEINRGLVVYVCFMKGATSDTVDKMVKAAMNARLSSLDDGTSKLVSILDLPGEVIIIPQATLGGNLKGKMMQYHRNISKEEGLDLYTSFVRQCQDLLEQSNKTKEQHKQVKYGTYGNRQVFSMVTNGPFSHYLEF